MEKVVQKCSQDKVTAKSTIDKNKKQESTEISMKEFLDFLRTAYQVTDSVEDTLSAEGMIEAVDWLKLKNSELVKPKAVYVQTSATDLGDEKGDALKIKLNEVLEEGLLDSVLPYMIPANAKKSHMKMSDRSGHNSGSSARTTSSKNERKRSQEAPPKPMKTDSEVEIHVCDEIKNVKKDFICSQKLLVEKMGYFAEVTAGQKLEDMDISVHCDIQIFEWLMRWVKRERIPEENWPVLDSQCVVPILVSAAFLLMEPLLQDCLLYCHENMNDILQNSNNLNCLNDSIITRLAAMYTNSELEAIKDKRDKIQSRLFTKMIISLVDPVCESVRGHWNSLARIYRCSKCEQLVMPEINKLLPCQPNCMSLNRYGDLVSHHQRDPNWDINDYINQLQSKLKTWRRVYWHLWGDCHYLFCTVCNKPFPAHRFKWCCYHPDEPQFFTVDSQKAPLPIGRYPCCGERAYRFEVLDHNTGCQFREHVPRTSQPRDEAVFTILENFHNVIEIEPPELIFPERLTRLVARDSSVPDGKLNCKDSFWWEGLQLYPANQQQGLLDRVKTPIPESMRSEYPEPLDESSEELSTSDSTSGSTHSEEENPPPQIPVTKRKQVKKKVVGKLWQLNLSARSNQDLQRSNEEALLSKMINYLDKKHTGSSMVKHKGFLRHITPPGGIYTRLEAEWKEANCSYSNKRLNSYMNKPKIKATRIT